MRPADKVAALSTRGNNLWTHAAVVAVAAVVMASQTAGVFGTWLALAALLVSLPPLFGPQLQRLVAAARTRIPGPRTIPLLVFAGVLVCLLGELLLGHPPASRDHAIHFFQTAELVDLVHAGNFHGFSLALNNGIAIGEHYPILGYLWTAAAHLLSGGLISLRASYALGLFAVWTVAAASVGLVAHTLFLSLSDNPKHRKHLRGAAWAGCIGASLWLLDEGYSREGGWHYLMFHGVWPQLLSTALWTLSLPAAIAMMKAPSPRRIAWVALCLAGSILAHPFGLLTGATSMGLLPVVAWVCGEKGSNTPRSYLAWGLGLGLAAALAAGWLSIFFAHASTLGRTPVPWESWSQLSSELLTGELFHDQRAWVGPLAVIGLLVAIARARLVTWWLAATTIALCLLGSTAAITILRLDLVVSGFKNLQFIRYAIAIKPLWYALAGVGAAITARGLWPVARRARPIIYVHLQQRRRQIALAVLAAPLLWGGYNGCSQVIARPVGGLHTLESSHHGADEAALKKLLIQEQRDSEVPLKVAFLRQQMGGGLYPLMSLSDLDIPTVLDGHVPTVNSVYRIEHRRAGLLHDLGVTHVLRDRPLPDREQNLADTLVPVGTAGPYILENFDPPPDLPSNRPGRLPGVFLWKHPAAQVKTVVADPALGTWAWELSGFGQQPSTIESLWAPLPGFTWSFTPTGGTTIPVEHTPASLSRGGLTGMRVNLPGGDGRLELRRLPLGNPVWRYVSWLAWALALLGLVFARTFKTSDRTWPSWVSRTLQLSLVAGAVTMALLLTQRQHKLLDRTWVDDEAFSKQARFVRDLVDAGSYQVVRTPNSLCDGMLGRDSRRGCSRDAQKTQVGMLYRKPFLYRCVQVTVPGQGSAQVAFTELGDAFVRGIVARDTGMPGRGEQLKWRAGERTQLRRLGRQKHRFESPADDGRYVVEVVNESRRDETVCVAAAVVEPER